MYDSNGNLQRITIISEHLGGFNKEPLNFSAKKLDGNLQGTIESMMPNLTTSAPEASGWKRLEELSDNCQPLHFPSGVSISCPRQVRGGEEMLFIMDWWGNPFLLQRGIRHFDQSGFKLFTLERFSVNY